MNELTQAQRDQSNSQAEEESVVCEWFARCTNPATHLEPHPAFPDGVPTCDRCQEVVR